MFTRERASPPAELHNRPSCFGRRPPSGARTSRAPSSRPSRYGWSTETTRRASLARRHQPGRASPGAESNRCPRALPSPGLLEEGQAEHDSLRNEPRFQRLLARLKVAPARRNWPERLRGLAAFGRVHRISARTKATEFSADSQDSAPGLLLRSTRRDVDRGSVSQAMVGTGRGSRSSTTTSEAEA